MKSIWKRGQIVVVMVVAATQMAMAGVSLPAVFSHHMVLQQKMAVPVWGSAGKGEKVVVRFAGQEKTAVADDQGRWSVRLDALAADAKPQSLTIAGSNTVVFTNVLVGEVWLCSGQSNMGMGVGQCANGAAEIAAANDPELRLFDMTVQNKCWDPCTPATAAAKGLWGGISGAAYFFGRDIRKEIKVPVGLITTTLGGTPVHRWTPRAAQEAVPALKAKVAPLGNEVVGDLYDNRIAPLVPFGLRGVLWYQGEGDFPVAYRQAMAALITSWRAAWDQPVSADSSGPKRDFPFYYVQLAGFRGVPNERILEAQLQTLALPETGMASAVDLGGGDVHALNKQDIGHRLALVALARTYGQKIPYSGPIYKGHTVEGNRLRITFDHAESGLFYGVKEGLKPAEPVAAGAIHWFHDENGKGTSSARGELNSILIAGEDKKWVPAATVIDGSTLVVFSPQVSKPVAVRYAYVEDPSTAPLGENCLLYNKEGLPASPFRTDDW